MFSDGWLTFSLPSLLFLELPSDGLLSGLLTLLTGDGTGAAAGLLPLLLFDSLSLPAVLLTDCALPPGIAACWLLPADAFSVLPDGPEAFPFCTEPL